MLKEECGLMGVFHVPEAAKLAFLGLHALQHRGQEACGVACFQNEKSKEVVFHTYKGFGLVTDVMNKYSFENCSGNVALGHVRYSTQGGRLVQNIQPFVFKIPYHGQVAVAHNGNLTNAVALRKELESSGSIFTTTSDSEVFIHLLARSKKKRLRERLAEVVQIVKGAYSLVLIARNRIYGLRDAHGFRPLVIGKKDDSYIIASETCAFDLIGASFAREVEPGEIVRIDQKKVISFYPQKKLQKRSFCSFEPIYFSRPDSIYDQSTVYESRKRMGEILAEENPVDADLVIAVPDSGVPAAIGYANSTGLPLELGLVRNHYVGRTFIEPSQQIRDLGVRLKLNPVFSSLKGKRVVVVDDSVVRGTTCLKIIRMMREAGAKEIHMRISSPPITHSCFYGVSTPTRGQLLAAQKTTKEICSMLEADSLAFLSRSGLASSLKDLEKDRHCYACFSGSYPEEIFQTISREPTDEKGPGYCYSTKV
jgi:amidophosphoribosyltransferase